MFEQKESVTRSQIRRKWNKNGILGLIAVDICLVWSSNEMPLVGMNPYLGLDLDAGATLDRAHKTIRVSYLGEPRPKGLVLGLLDLDDENHWLRENEARVIHQQGCARWEDAANTNAEN